MPPKNVRPKLIPRYLEFGNVLDCRPIFSRDKRFIPQPFGDGLLTETLAVDVLSDAASQGGLAAGDPNGAAQSIDMRLHADDVTTMVVKVNNLGGVPRASGQVTVPFMAGSAARKRKTAAKQAPTIRRDSQGRSLGDRLLLAMAAKSEAIGRSYQAKELLADAHRLSGLPDNQPVCTQQNFSKIVNHKTSESVATPAFAAALGVTAIWLQYGNGPSSVFDAALAKRLAK